MLLEKNESSIRPIYQSILRHLLHLKQVMLNRSGETLQKPDICLLAGNNVAIHHSTLGHSSWGIVGLKYGGNVVLERIKKFLNAMMVEKK